MSRRPRLSVGWIVAALVICSFFTPARAQDPGSGVPAAIAEGDDWSFVITPQVWISHILKNGFGAAGTVAPGGTFIDCGGGPGSCGRIEQTPYDALNPQWGVQFAAQKGRLSLAAAVQYVTFETRNDYIYDPEDGFTRAFPLITGGVTTISPGEQFAQEFVYTTRVDMDLSASYFFPDVVKDRLDFSIGGGFKFIYANASRQFANMSQLAAGINALVPSGLYLICKQDDCSDFNFKDRVKEYSYIFGVTMPLSAVWRLTDDARWLLPVSLTPLLGAEIRNDENVVYAFNNNGTVKRLDGTKFAFGFTADATLRWLINETFSAYAGMRVQFIEGFNQYLAFGGLVGMSVRFGGK